MAKCFKLLTKVFVDGVDISRNHAKCLKTKKVSVDRMHFPRKIYCI
jgi:hypothetical protein